MGRQARQASLAGGEIAPELYGRSDLDAYQATARRIRNFLPCVEGAAKNRPGLLLIREVPNSAKKNRLVPFIFGGGQNYILEFSDLLMRVIRDGAYVGAPFTLVTPFTEAQLPYLKFAQSGDTLMVTVGNTQPRVITRVSDASWTIAAWSTGRSQAAPTSVTCSTNTADATHVAKDWAYVVTAVSGPDIVEESLPSTAYRISSHVVYPDRPATVSWAAAANAVSYNVYRGQGGQTFMGFIGNTTSTSFRDDGQIPVYAEAPPTGRDPFSGGGGKYPQVVTYFNQRLWFANSVNAPEALWASQIGMFKNFDSSDPPKESDGMLLNIASRTYDEIRSIVPLGQMLMFCAGSEWVLMGLQGNPPSPSGIDARPRSYWGSSWLDPVIVGDTPLFITEKENHVREFKWRADTDEAGGRDLTTIAGHLFRNHSIVDWAYQRSPFSTVWLVRDDGVLLSLGYRGDGSYLAWAWHDTEGTFENVACCPEGTEDAVYVVVKRTVNGATKRYVERFATRAITSARTGIFLDCATYTSGLNTGATTMRANGASYAVGASVTITASTSTFVAGDVGKEIVLAPGSKAGNCRFLITAYTSGTSVTASCVNETLSAWQNVATTNWGWGRKVFTGLTHLEACTVYANIDGNAYGPYTVSGGSVTLDVPGVYVTIGRRYLSEIELNDLIDSPQFKGPDNMTPRLVKSVQFEVADTAGVLAGESFSRLTAWNPATAIEDYDTQMFTGQIMVHIDSAWNKYGRAVLQQPFPLPVTVVAVSREIETGDPGGGLR